MLNPNDWFNMIKIKPVNGPNDKLSVEMISIPLGRNGLMVKKTIK